MATMMRTCFAWLICLMVTCSYAASTSASVDGHMVCSKPLGITSVALVWHDAVFTIPKTAQKQVLLSTVPNIITETVCTIESMTFGFFGLFHYLDQCGDESGRVPGRRLIGGEVACEKGDDVCYVRASPFSSPCLFLPASSQWDDIDIGKLEFWGHSISVFEGIVGVPFEEHSPYLFWEETIAEIVTRNPIFSGLWRYPTYLVCALCVSFGSDALVENRAFQLVFAATFGVSVFMLLALLILFLVFSHLLKISQQTAWGGFLVHSAFFLPPVAALCYRFLMGRLFAFLSVMGSFWSMGTCPLDATGACACTVCAPWAGKAYFIAGAMLGVIAELNTSFLKYPAYIYEEQGWNTMKCGQKHLERGLSLTSFLLYSQCSSADASFLLALLMTKSVRQQISHWLLLIHIAKNRQPYYANGGQLKTMSQYEQDKQSTTERELSRLRIYLQQQNKELDSKGDNSLRRACFDDETTRRLDSFRLGSADVQRQRRDGLESERSLMKSIKSTAITVIVVVVCFAAAYYS